MKVFSKSDIVKIIREAESESQSDSRDLVAKVGPTVVIGPGLKVRHKNSGLVYTVVDIFDDLSLHCQRPGRNIVISPKQFKDYERE